MAEHLKEFYGAIKAHGDDVKVAFTREEVSQWFREHGVINANGLVWFEGHVSEKGDSFTFALCEESKDAVLSQSQKNCVTLEVSCLVQYYFGVKGVLPGWAKGAIKGFVEGIRTKE
jgi:hypothetical protein